MRCLPRCSGPQLPLPHPKPAMPQRPSSLPEPRIKAREKTNMAEIAILRRKPQSSEVVPHERTELLDEGASTTDTGRAGRIGLWALAIGFGGFLLWAALAPLDEGVPAPGLVSIDTKRKT